MDRWLLPLLTGVFLAITLMGLFFSRYLLPSLGLFGVWIVLDLQLKERKPAVKGILSLMILVFAARQLLTSAGSLFQLLHGSIPPPPEVWELPLLLFALILGEIVRKTGHGKAGLLLILLSFFAALGTAASLMLDPRFRPAADITASIMLLPLIVLSGLWAYRFSLSLVEKLAN